MKKYWVKKILLFSLCFVAFALALGWVVMTLWNEILPAVIGVNRISFLQAIGILILSKILFGGFNTRFGGRQREDCKLKLKEKFANMTAEEKDKFKNEWKTRCSNSWKMKTPETTEDRS